ncbi:MAG: YfiR/HmsC family protein [Myxococcota bacterium]
MTWLRAIVVAVVSLAAVPASANDQLAVVLLKAISYERGLASRAGDQVVIAVPVPEGRANPRFFKSLKRVEKVRLAKKAISVSRVDYADPSRLTGALEAVSADFVFTSAELSAEDLLAVLRVCAQSKVPSVGVSKMLVEKGVSLGVELVGKKPRIFVNVKTSKSQGASYSSDLLELAVPVR